MTTNKKQQNLWCGLFLFPISLCCLAAACPSQRTLPDSLFLWMVSVTDLRPAALSLHSEGFRNGCSCCYSAEMLDEPHKHRHRPLISHCCEVVFSLTFELMSAFFLNLCIVHLCSCRDFGEERQQSVFWSWHLWVFHGFIEFYKVFCWDKKCWHVAKVNGTLVFSGKLEICNSPKLNFFCIVPSDWSYT